jgi:hypothetical protein
LAVAVGWDQAAQEALDTPIEEENLRLDLNIGDDGYMDDVHTSGSTSLLAPMTDDEQPPPASPGGDDMELDMDIRKEGGVPLSVVSNRAPTQIAHVSLHCSRGGYSTVKL